MLDLINHINVHDVLVRSQYPIHTSVDLPRFGCRVHFLVVIIVTQSCKNVGETALKLEIHNDDKLR